ncbi:DUF6378 domain-containing protein [Aestuariivirga sp.]|uniref:DUF6378 domain-containing protein n=1 Tax=Aestuariivirga sp. TaxID=2650926 RepID=UPI00391A7E6D
MSRPAEQFLKHVANVIAERGSEYGEAAGSMAAVASRWSVTLGREITAAQVVLCLLDLKLARLAHDPAHEDSAVDVCGYAALLAEIANTPEAEGH